MAVQPCSTNATSATLSSTRQSREHRRVSLSIRRAPPPLRVPLPIPSIACCTAFYLAGEHGEVGHGREHADVDGRIVVPANAAVKSEPACAPKWKESLGCSSCSCEPARPRDAVPVTHLCLCKNK